MIFGLTERQQMEFALWSARRVQHLMRDPRSVAALDTRKRWLQGEATDEEMEAARAAASAAAWAAADASAAAAWDAAWDAARAAAWDAERAAQRAELERMLGEGCRVNWLVGIGRDGYPTAYPLDRVKVIWSIEPGEATIELRDNDEISVTLESAVIVDEARIMPMIDAIRQPEAETDGSDD